MIENKYRAWDEENKEMIYYGVDTLINCIPSCIGMDTMWKKMYRLHHLFEYNNRDIIQMQYIGMMDKNKKEIFVGDIINYHHYDFVRNIHTDVPLIVVFKDEQFQQHHFNLDTSTHDENIAIWYEWNEVEVIDNIHENLRGTKK